MTRDESERVGEVYAAYGADPGRTRAWSAGNAGNRAIRAELTARLLGAADLRTGPLLDVGCGTGWWLRAVHDRHPDAQLHGVELLAERAAAATAAVPSAHVTTGDAVALPYDDGRFATVTLLTVLSSMDDDARRRSTLAEARRVLAPDGLLAIWEPRYTNPRNRQVQLVRRRLLGAALPGASVASITVVPQLARRLGPRAYGICARVPPLRSHRLVLYRA